jgi:lipoprotein signal peptidase
MKQLILYPQRYFFREKSLLVYITVMLDRIFKENITQQVCRNLQQRLPFTSNLTCSFNHEDNFSSTARSIYITQSFFVFQHILCIIIQERLPEQKSFHIEQTEP